MTFFNSLNDSKETFWYRFLVTFCVTNGCYKLNYYYLSKFLSMKEKKGRKEGNFDICFPVVSNVGCVKGRSRTLFVELC